MRIEVKVQAVTETILVDTGSAVSILSSETYSKLKCPALLQQTSAVLFDYSHRNIAGRGCFIATVLFRDRHAEVPFYVVLVGTEILGIDAVTALCLQINGTSLNCFHTTQTPPKLSPDLYRQFPLFDGKLGRARSFIHKVRLSEDVKPVAAKLHRLPFSLREQVTEEMKSLEFEDLILKESTTRYVYHPFSS